MTARELTAGSTKPARRRAAVLANLSGVVASDVADATGVAVSGHVISPRRRGIGWNRSAGSAPYLDDVDPDLAEGLQRELSARGYREAADAVFDLRLGEPCRCGDRDCASFYASGGLGIGWLWRRRLETVTLRTDPVLRVSLVGGRIVAVEVSDRPALRAALQVGAGDR